MRHGLLALIVTLASFGVIGSAQALTLDVWNVAQLDASDDYIDLQLGSSNGNTTLTLQWVGGAADTPGAIGVDKLFINNVDLSLAVAGVYVDAIDSSNNVTSSWLPTNGGTSAGGGFGLFVEKVAAPGGSGGIAPSSLIFVLASSYAPSSFIANSSGASFAAHVRYANGCSGWVADGGTGGGDFSSSCGGPTDSVPEPSAAVVFCAGALVFAATIRRRA